MSHLHDLVQETRETVQEAYYRRRPRRRGPAPKHDVPYGLDGYYDERGRYAIARHLRDHESVRVWDPNNILLKLDVGAWLKNELGDYFGGVIETAAENLADLDDPDMRAEMHRRQKGAMKAAQDWKKVKVTSKRGSDGVVTLTMRPTLKAVSQKHGIWL